MLREGRGKILVGEVGRIPVPVRPSITHHRSVTDSCNATRVHFATATRSVRTTTPNMPDGCPVFLVFSTAHDLLRWGTNDCVAMSTQFHKDSSLHFILPKQNRGGSPLPAFVGSRQDCFSTVSVAAVPRPVPTDLDDHGSTILAGEDPVNNRRGSTTPLLDIFPWNHTGESNGSGAPSVDTCLLAG